MQNNQPYVIRFGFVGLLNYFVKETYLPDLFSFLDNQVTEHYYVKMAAAWLLSLMYIRYPLITNDYLKHSALDDWTFNKGIQKCLESTRLSKETKEKLKAQKR